MNKKTIITALLALVSFIASAAVPDSIQALIADFNSIVEVAEKDYAAFKFKVTDSNRKEYETLKKKLVTDIKKQRRNWQDAVCAYVGWFGDFHFCVKGNDEIWTNYCKYARNRIDYNALLEIYDPKLVSCKVDDDTWLIRFPFCYDTRNWGKVSIDEYKASGCPNLIIDIRGNSGGQDDNFLPILQLLYDTDSGKRDGSMFRFTEANIRRNEWTKEDLLDLGYPTDANDAPEYVVKIEDGSSIVFDSISQYPKKAALIIDNKVASSGEQLVLEIKACSNRTTIYGKDNTRGCIDTGNCLDFIPSNQQLIVQYSTTYSMRYEKGTSVDMTGIAPDVRIPLPYPKRLSNNIDEWVLWVAEELKR